MSELSLKIRLSPRVPLTIVLTVLVGWLVSGWGFIDIKPQSNSTGTSAENIQLREIPLGISERELRQLKGLPTWQTADGELVYEEETASFSVLLNADTNRVSKVCEAGDHFKVLDVRGGDSLTRVIETVGMPSTETLNSGATQGQVFYAEHGVSFHFRDRRVQEVCVLDEQHRQMLAGR